MSALQLVSKELGSLRQIKNLLRKAAARTEEALVEAIAAALSAISAQDARGFFEHAGDRPTGQLP